jgi:hypothetical protein
MEIFHTVYIWEYHQLQKRKTTKSEIIATINTNKKIIIR